MFFFNAPAVSAHSQARFGSLFRILDGRLQEAVVEELDRLVTADEQAFLGQFFRIVREHTVQGYFGDPAYGGNRGADSWALIGFPGAQQRYSDEQLNPGFNASEVPIVTVNDLYRRIHERRHGPAESENDDQFVEGEGGDPVAVLGSTEPAERP